jgi:hypothetical protein
VCPAQLPQLADPQPQNDRVRHGEATIRRQSDGADFGAWLFKCNPRRRDFQRSLSESDGSTEWCVAGSYRATLIRPGQPVILWVSGSDARGPTPGIWAVGQTISDAAADDADPSGANSWRARHLDTRVQLSLRLLAEPVPRAVLRHHAALERLEVLRIPAGSNPSWVTGSEFAALLAVVE